VVLPSTSTIAVLRKEMEGRTSASKQLAVFADPVFDKQDERSEALATTGQQPVSGARLAKGSLNAPAEDKKPVPEGAVVKAAAGPEKPAAPAGDTLSRELLHLAFEKSAKETGAADSAFRIRRLPGTANEAQAILQLLPARETMLATGFDANRAAATSDTMSQYRIIHFATHGFLNSVHPELSGVVLSMVDKSGNPQDGFLRLGDIYNLKLNADLVVLSACQTGLGKDVKGEGRTGRLDAWVFVCRRPTSCG
jgi:hypothetical protein